MSYSTYFNGELNIKLNGAVLKVLQEYISKNLKERDALLVEKNRLIVDGEWKDSGFMQKIVLFIKQNGQLESGCILCEGEDMQDI